MVYVGASDHVGMENGISAALFGKIGKLLSSPPLNTSQINSGATKRM